MKVELELRGQTELARAFRLLGPQGTKAMAMALFQEGERIMAAAKMLTPVDTGVLVGSGHVQLPVIQGDSVAVTLGFGGAASDYAVEVHESLTAYHRPPTQAKYLEQPFMEAQVGMEMRLAQDLWTELK